MVSKLTAILRSFAGWLERKFPDRDQQSRILGQIAAAMQAHEDKLKQFEQEINKFNVALGFGGKISQLPSAFQR